MNVKCTPAADTKMLAATLARYQRYGRAETPGMEPSSQKYALLSRQISVLSAILQSANRLWKRALRCGYDLPLKETCFVLMGLLLRIIVTRGVVNADFCAKLRTSFAPRYMRLCQHHAKD